MSKKRVTRTCKCGAKGRTTADTYVCKSCQQKNIKMKAAEADTGSIKTKKEKEKLISGESGAKLTVMGEQLKEMYHEIGKISENVNGTKRFKKRCEVAQRFAQRMKKKLETINNM